MEELLLTFMIVFGVLQIILFFKIWGTTNEINNLKATICNEIQTTNKTDNLRKKLLLYIAEEAYEFLNERLTDEILTIYKDCKNKSNAENHITYGKIKLPMQEVFERKKADIIDEYKSYYAIFEKTIPIELMEIKMENLQEIK